LNIHDVEIGSIWYVQLAPQAALVEREVTAVTELTIVLRDPYTLSTPDKHRYRFDEITLVESC